MNIIKKKELPEELWYPNLFHSKGSDLVRYETATVAVQHRDWSKSWYIYETYWGYDV